MSVYYYSHFACSILYLLVVLEPSSEHGLLPRRRRETYFDLF